MKENSCTLDEYIESNSFKIDNYINDETEYWKEIVKKYFKDCFKLELEIVAMHCPDMSYFRCYGNYNETDVEKITKIYPRAEIYPNQKIFISLESSINMIKLLRFDYETILDIYYAENEKEKTELIKKHKEKDIEDAKKDNEYGNIY